MYIGFLYNDRLCRFVIPAKVISDFSGSVVATIGRYRYLLCDVGLMDFSDLSGACVATIKEI